MELAAPPALLNGNDEVVSLHGALLRAATSDTTRVPSKRFLRVLYKWLQRLRFAQGTGKEGEHATVQLHAVRKPLEAAVGRIMAFTEWMMELQIEGRQSGAEAGCEADDAADSAPVQARPGALIHLHSDKAVAALVAAFHRRGELALADQAYGWLLALVVRQAALMDEVRQYEAVRKRERSPDSDSDGDGDADATQASVGQEQERTYTHHCSLMGRTTSCAGWSPRALPGALVHSEHTSAAPTSTLQDGMVASPHARAAALLPWATGLMVEMHLSTACGCLGSELEHSEGQHAPAPAPAPVSPPPPPALGFRSHFDRAMKLYREWRAASTSVSRRWQAGTAADAAPVSSSSSSAMLFSRSAPQSVGPAAALLKGLGRMYCVQYSRAMDHHTSADAPASGLASPLLRALQDAPAEICRPETPAGAGSDAKATALQLVLALTRSVMQHAAALMSRSRVLDSDSDSGSASHAESSPLTPIGEWRTDAAAAVRAARTAARVESAAEPKHSPLRGRAEVHLGAHPVQHIHCLALQVCVTCAATTASFGHGEEAKLAIGDTAQHVIRSMSQCGIAHVLTNECGAQLRMLRRLGVRVAVDAEVEPSNLSVFLGLRSVYGDALQSANASTATDIDALDAQISTYEPQLEALEHHLWQTMGPVPAVQSTGEQHSAAGSTDACEEVSVSASEWCSWLWHDTMTPSEQHGARAAAADLRYFLQLLDCEYSGEEADNRRGTDHKDDQSGASGATSNRQLVPNAYNLVTREAFDECLRRCRRHACRKVGTGPGKVEIDSAEAAAARVMALLAAMHVLGTLGPAALRARLPRRSVGADTVAGEGTEAHAYAQAAMPYLLPDVDTYAAAIDALFATRSRAQPPPGSFEGRSPALIRGHPPFLLAIALYRHCTRVQLVPPNPAILSSLVFGALRARAWRYAVEGLHQMRSHGFPPHRRLLRRFLRRLGCGGSAVLTLGFELVEQYSREESAKPPRACSAVDGNTVTAAGDDDDVQDADDCAPSGSGCNNKLYPRGESSTMHLLAALVESCAVHGSFTSTLRAANRMQQAFVAQCSKGGENAVQQLPGMLREHPGVMADLLLSFVKACALSPSTDDDYVVDDGDAETEGDTQRALKRLEKLQQDGHVTPILALIMRSVLFECFEPPKFTDCANRRPCNGVLSRASRLLECRRSWFRQLCNALSTEPHGQSYRSLSLGLCGRCVELNTTESRTVDEANSAPIVLYTACRAILESVPASATAKAPAETDAVKPSVACSNDSLEVSAQVASLLWSQSLCAMFEAVRSAKQRTDMSDMIRGALKRASDVTSAGPTSSDGGADALEVDTFVMQSLAHLWCLGMAERNQIKVTRIVTGAFDAIGTDSKPQTSMLHAVTSPGTVLQRGAAKLLGWARQGKLQPHLMNVLLHWLRERASLHIPEEMRCAMLCPVSFSHAWSEQGTTIRNMIGHVTVECFRSRGNPGDARDEANDRTEEDEAAGGDKDNEIDGDDEEDCDPIVGVAGGAVTSESEARVTQTILNGACALVRPVKSRFKLSVLVRFVTEQRLLFALPPSVVLGAAVHYAIKGANVQPLLALCEPVPGGMTPKQAQHALGRVERAYFAAARVVIAAAVLLLHAPADVCAGKRKGQKNGSVAYALDQHSNDTATHAARLQLQLLTRLCHRWSWSDAKDIGSELMRESSADGATCATAATADGDGDALACTAIATETSKWFSLVAADANAQISDSGNARTAPAVVAVRNWRALSDADGPFDPNMSHGDDERVGGDGDAQCSTIAGERTQRWQLPAPPAAAPDQQISWEEVVQYVASSCAQVTAEADADDVEVDDASEEAAFRAARAEAAIEAKPRITGTAQPAPATFICLAPVSRVIVVEDADALSTLIQPRIEAALRRAGANESRPVLVGLDAEWQPAARSLADAARADPNRKARRRRGASDQRGSAGPVSLLQLSLPWAGRLAEHGAENDASVGAAAVLIDLLRVLQPLPADESKVLPDGSSSAAAVKAFLRWLFEHEAVVVVGFGLRGDIAKLASSYPQLGWSSDRETAGLDGGGGNTETAPAVCVARSLELQELRDASAADAAGCSLSALAQRTLGARIDKQYQVSHWGRRPLLPEQIRYAALDACVLPAIAARILAQRGDRVTCASTGASSTAGTGAPQDPIFAGCTTYSCAHGSSSSADQVDVEPTAWQWLLDTAAHSSHSEEAKSAAPAEARAGPCALREPVPLETPGAQPDAQCALGVASVETAAKRLGLFQSSAFQYSSREHEQSATAPLPPEVKPGDVEVKSLGLLLGSGEGAAARRQRHVLCVLPLDARLSLGAVARACGPGTTRASLRFAEPHTLVERFGHERGNLGPIGLRHESSTLVLVDVSLVGGRGAGAALLVGAGAPGMVLRVEAAALLGALELVRAAPIVAAEPQTTPPCDAAQRQHGSGQLKAQCSYSFADLYRAAHPNATQVDEALKSLYALSQDERNVSVRAWCAQAGWFWEDQSGADGAVYAAFSPERTATPCGSCDM